MKQVLIVLIKIYKITISPILDQVVQVHCRHVETCSDYSMRAIKENGALKGLMISFKRFLRCQPFAQKYV